MMSMDFSAYIPFVEECFAGKPYTLQEVAGGRSYDIKMKVSCEGKDYIIKVIGGNSDEPCDRSRLAWYQALCRVQKEDPCVLGPVWYGWANDRVVTITEWIVGEQLNDAFDRDPELMIPLGKKVGKLFHKLHHQDFVRETLRAGNVDVAGKITAATDRIVDEVKSLGLEFRGLDRALAYLEENRSLISQERASIMHNDIRPENFIFSDGKIYIYDFDSGTVNDCYADFTYLSAISQGRYRPFSYAVIMSYFDGRIPREFWQANLFFSITKLLDYAIYKYRNSGKMIVNQANNFMEVFDGYHTAVPCWWKELEERYGADNF